MGSQLGETLPVEQNAIQCAAGARNTSGRKETQALKGKSRQRVSDASLFLYQPEPLFRGSAVTEDTHRLAETISVQLVLP